MKKLMIIAAISLALILAGCSNGNDARIDTKPFVGGTNGIEIEFIEGSPPPEVFDSRSFPFDVVIKTENKGEYDVLKEDVAITLKGIYPPDFNVQDTTLLSQIPEEDLDGAYIDSDGNIIPGVVTFVNTFPELSYQPTLAGNNPFTIRAEVCYKYGVQAQADVCYLEDLTKLEDKVCEVNEKKAIQASSSPIQIENFEQNIAGTDKITFSFEIVHRGAGAISMPDVASERCSTDLAMKNKVKIRIDSGVAGLRCSGLTTGAGDNEDQSDSLETGTVTLFGGKRMVRCTQDANVNTDYEKKVNILVQYDYKENVDTNLLVKHMTDGTSNIGDDNVP
ncbi:TPA: hypothetical protein HA361_01280 [Candidatus Woesearchaeota archaeon]|nr:hypothetical protein [Candidatus Woesearchaeota archaeon]HII69276.1 hypothetical protein [Candidatus Woesearchaeota archaeon]